MGPIPQVPAFTAAQLSATEFPTGFTVPMPVITTLRLSISFTSSNGYAAVHAQHLSGDIGTLRRGEEGHRLGYLLRGAGAALGDGGQHGLPGLVGQGGGHVGLNKAGGHRVHRDVPAGKLLGGRFHQADNPRLAGCVGGLARVASQANDAGQADNPPVFLAQHHLGRRLGTEVGAFQVGVQGFGKVLLLGGHKQAVPGDAGVVHQNVQPAETLLHCRDQSLAGGGVGHVGLKGLRLHPQGPTQLYRLRRRRGAAPIVDGHRRPPPGQLQTDSPPDPPAAAGDQSHVSLQAHAVSPFKADTTLWKSAAVSMW